MRINITFYILALLLCVRCTSASAQLPTHASAGLANRIPQQKMMPLRRTYASYQSEYNNRFTMRSSTPAPATGIHPELLQSRRSYMETRQALVAKYPALQATTGIGYTHLDQGRALPLQQPYSFYQQQAQRSLHTAAEGRGNKNK
ncbi:MAG: hypothetical protein ABIQ88_03865 [Chitinophagaceae bacterium]